MPNILQGNAGSVAGNRYTDPTGAEADLIMTTEHNHIQELIDKLETLPPERVTEVEDFIDFIKQRDQGRQLTHTATQTAKQSFNQVWDNPEDAVYDTL